MSDENWPSGFCLTCGKPRNWRVAQDRSRLLAAAHRVLTTNWPATAWHGDGEAALAELARAVADAEGRP